MHGKLPLGATHWDLMDYIWRLLFNINHSDEVTPLIREQRNNLAAHYAHEAPARLFRYRPLEKDTVVRELEVLKSHKMWFSAIDVLNDPFETYVQDSLVDDTFHEILVQYPLLSTMPKGNIERFKENLEKKLSPLGYQEHVDKFWKSSGVSCLSETYDNKLMWSHYASNNTGMCIEYCTQELVQNTGFIMAPVNYSSEPPSTKINGCTEAFLMSAIFSKSSDWGYEREWRCLLARSADETYDSYTLFSEQNGVLLDTSSAKAVYLGCKIDNSSREKVINLCKDALNVPVYIMERKQSAYSLTPKILYSPSTVHDKTGQF